jgi:hypothetical protein
LAGWYQAAYLAGAVGNRVSSLYSFVVLPSCG